ncbi:DeoR/GlpR family DNA-binding transcription regulator [Rhizobium sp.]
MASLGATRIGRPTLRPSKRHDEISALLVQAGELSVEELADRLDVSRETIRRDLTKMDGEGRLKKFHGGARAAGNGGEATVNEGPFAIRMAENYDSKRKIAVAAAALLKADDSLFVDTGSTTVAFADEIAKVPSLMVITNSHRIAATVGVNSANKVFLIGGAYAADAGESVGPLAIEQIGKFRARYAVLTVGAIDTSSLMDFDLQEAEVAKAMIDRADKVIVLADHTKFEQRAVFEVAPVTAVDIVVTDRPPSPAVVAFLASSNVELVIA